MAQDKPLVEGKYLMFKGKPFVCENNTYCYGDMTDNFVLFLGVLKYKEIKGSDGNTVEVPENVLIQIRSTDATKSEAERVVKQGVKPTLYEAMDLGLIWLDKYNKG